MKMLAVVTTTVLICCAVHAATPTATIDPTVTPNKTDQMRPPPPPTNVNVLNFPETQAVEGTVAVSNLPAVQTVGGTVNVGNLPFDPHGNLRVSTAPPRQPVLVEMLTETIRIDPQTSFVSPTLDTTGYSHVGFRFEGTQIAAEIRWRWHDSQTFEQVYDVRNGALASSCVAWAPTGRMVCAVSGEELQLVITNPYGEGVPIFFSSLKVYLIP